MRLSRRLTNRLFSWWPRRSLIPSAVPEWARPLVRLAVTILVVFVGDRVTGLLIDQGWTMGWGVLTALRIVSALPILRFPLAGFLLALEVDKWDWYWLGAGSRSEEFQALYQEWDKVLDLFVLGLAAIVVLGWRDRRMRALALTAFVWRALGVTVFLVNEQGWTMVVFPNVFQSLFIMYLVYYLVSGHARMVRSSAAAALTLLATVPPKLAEEYFVHVVRGRPGDYVDLPVPDAIAPTLWVALMYLPALVVVVAFTVTGRGTSAEGDRETQLSVA